MENNFANRLKRALSIRNVKQSELVEMTRISKSAISQYLSGAFEPKQKNIYKIAKALDVNPAWMMGKEVEMDSAPPIPSKTTQLNVRSVPILGTIAAGTPILAEQNIEDFFNIDSKIKADFALRIKGDSMLGAGIFPGDIVFIHQQPELENGEIGAVLIEDSATLKKFYKEEGTVILQAENDKYGPIVLHNGNVKILGKLAAVLNIRE